MRKEKKKKLKCWLKGLMLFVFLVICKILVFLKLNEGFFDKIYFFGIVFFRIIELFFLDLS